MPTFATAAEAVLAQMRPGWRNPKHGKDWLSSMERFAFPRLGKLPVSEVTSANMVETLRKVWHERPATARRVRQRISTVMEWAVALNYRDDNRAAGSGRSSARNRISSGTCRRCRIATWRRSSRRCERRGRLPSLSWPSSFWC